MTGRVAHGRPFIFFRHRAATLRMTLVGSMMPLVTRLPYSQVCESKPLLYWSFLRSLPTMTEPYSPALTAIWRGSATRCHLLRANRRGGATA